MVWLTDGFDKRPGNLVAKCRSRVTTLKKTIELNVIQLNQNRPTLHFILLKQT